MGGAISPILCWEEALQEGVTCLGVCLGIDNSDIPSAVGGDDMIIGDMRPL